MTVVAKTVKPRVRITDATPEASSKPFDPFLNGDLMPMGAPNSPLSGQIVPAEWPEAPVPTIPNLTLDPPTFSPKPTTLQPEPQRPSPPPALDVKTAIAPVRDADGLIRLVSELGGQWLDNSSPTGDVPMSQVPTLLRQAERLGWTADIPSAWTEADENRLAAKSKRDSLIELRTALLATYAPDAPEIQDVDRDIAGATAKLQEAEAALANGRVRITFRPR